MANISFDKITLQSNISDAEPGIYTDETYTKLIIVSANKLFNEDGRQVYGLSATGGYITNESFKVVRIVEINVKTY